MPGPSGGKSFETERDTRSVSIMASPEKSRASTVKRHERTQQRDLDLGFGLRTGS